MVGIMISTVVGSFFGHQSVYEHAIRRLNYPFLDVKDEVPPHFRVRDAMSQKLIVIPMHGHTVQSLQDIMKDAERMKITGFPIVTSMEHVNNKQTVDEHQHIHWKLFCFIVFILLLLFVCLLDVNCWLYYLF
jgi:hypothetical protein